MELDEFRQVYRSRITRMGITVKPEMTSGVERIFLEIGREKTKSLTRDDLKHIVEIEVKSVQDRLEEKKIELKLDDDAKAFLIDKGFDRVFGARPLKRTIQKYLENSLAEEILSGIFKEGDKIKATVSKSKDRLDFEKVQKKSVAKKR